MHIDHRPRHIIRLVRQQIRDQLESCALEPPSAVAQGVPRVMLRCRRVERGRRGAFHDYAPGAGRPAPALLGSSISSASADQANSLAPMPRPSRGS